jgi:hypothetical protein
MASGIFTQRQVQREMIRGSWANLKTPAVEYLVVAGGSSGGGGASYAGGGGGAGGLLAGIAPIAVGSSITVTVGGGGAGTSGSGNNGLNSVFGNITASGGGGGSFTQTDSGLNGGSGGGGGGGTSDTFHPYGNGIQGQGNSGGFGKYYASGGGGGAGTKGIDGAGTFIPCGNGGAGVASAISGAVVTYSGGGGGGSYVSQTTGNGIGGVGGGGTGAYYSSAAGTAGTVNTGGGGGGGNQNFVTSGAGGSGIVIVSYPDVYANAVSQTNATYSTSGSGSLSFNGSNQYITTPTSSNLALGTSNFSVEAWVYKTTASGNQTFIGVSVSNNYSPIFGQTSNGANTFGLYLSSNGTSFDIASNVSMGTVSLNTWAHLAVTRVGSTFTTYLNGAVVSTFTSSASIYQTPNAFVIGASQTSFNYFNGYMSNVRIVIGASAYSAAFTPSTAPLTAITNTQLLLGTNSGAQFADSSTNSFASTATGSPTWNQLSPFATGLGYKNRVYTWTSSGTITF